MTITVEQQKANRKLWVEALRSGKYKQCAANLFDGEGYCCLGVLAIVAGYTDAEIKCFGTLTAHKLAMDFVGLSKRRWLATGSMAATL